MTRCCANGTTNYDSELPPSIELPALELNAFLENFAATEGGRRERLERAVRWYSTSIGHHSPIDAYPAAWIGLECIGAILGDYYHTVGVKAPCTVCKNVAGEWHNSGQAGLEHLLRQYAPELLQDRTFSDLRNLRNDMAHGLKSVDIMETTCRELLPDVQLSLAVGALVARDGPSTRQADPYGWRGAFPRDYAVHPDARVATLAEQPLPDHRPLYGGWIEVRRTFENEASRVVEDGIYERTADVRLGSSMNVPTGSPNPQRTYELFERTGISLTLADIEDAAGSPLPQLQWRTPPLSAAWRRQLGEE